MINGVTTLAPSFLNGSSSFFQATSKPTISWMGSKFSRIRPGTMSYLPMSIWKNSYRLIMGEMCNHSSAFNFEWIFFILVYNKDDNYSLDEFEFRQDPITEFGVGSPLAS